MLGPFPFGSTSQSVSGDVSLDGSIQNAWELTLIGNTALSLVNLRPGGFYFLAVTQDATGGRTITWSGVNNPAAPSLVSGETTFFAFVADSYGTANLTTYRQDSLLYPSGDTTGATDQAAIQAILDAGDIAYLGPGIFYIDAPLELSSNSGLVGQGSKFTEIRATFSGPASPSDVENAVIQAIGSTNAALVNTTLAAAVRQNATSITTASAVPTSAAGQLLRLRGNNAPDNYNIVSELVRVRSDHTTSTTVNLESPVVGELHISGKPVVAMNAIENLYLEGFKVTPTDDTLACCFGFKSARDVTFLDLAGSRASYAVMAAYGCSRIRGDRLTDYGTSNGGIFLETCQNVTITNVFRTGDGERVHPEGYPQPELGARAGCVDIQIRGGHVQKAVALARQWGGLDMIWGNFTADDLDPTEMCDNDPDGGVFATFGVILDQGPPSVAATDRSAEMGFNCSLHDVRATNVRSRDRYSTFATTGAQPAFYIHDHYRFKLTNCSVENVETDVNTTGAPLQGFIWSDCDAHISGVSVRGVDMGVRIQNVRANVTGDFSMQANSGTTSDPQAPAFVLALDNEGAALSPRRSPQLTQVTALNFGGSGGASDDATFWFTADWAAAPDRSFCIDTLILDYYRYEKVRPVRCPAFRSQGAGPPYEGPFVGQIGTLNETASKPPDVAVASAQTNRDVVFVSIPNNDSGQNWCMVAYDGATVSVQGATPGVGDSLIPNADGFAEVGVPVASHNHVWWMAAGEWDPTAAKMYCERQH